MRPFYIKLYFFKNKKQADLILSDSSSRTLLYGKCTLTEVVNCCFFYYSSHFTLKMSTFLNSYPKRPFLHCKHFNISAKKLFILQSVINPILTFIFKSSNFTVDKHFICLCFRDIWTCVLLLTLLLSTKVQISYHATEVFQTTFCELLCQTAEINENNTLTGWTARPCGKSRSAD